MDYRNNNYEMNYMNQPQNSTGTGHDNPNFSNYGFQYNTAQDYGIRSDPAAAPPPNYEDAMKQNYRSQSAQASAPVILDPWTIDHKYFYFPEPDPRYRTQPQPNERIEMTSIPLEPQPQPQPRIQPQPQPQPRIQPQPQYQKSKVCNNQFCMWLWLRIVIAVILGTITYLVYHFTS